jgi:hypothetical protein
MCALSSANISIGATKVQIFIETAKFLYIFGKNDWFTVYRLPFTIFISRRYRRSRRYFFRTKTEKTPSEALKLFSEFYVLSVMALSLKTSFYATATTLITTTRVVQALIKEKHAAFVKPKNNFYVNPSNYKSFISL